ncbi:MAG: glycine zipper 2TM domain-containing protein [Enterobacterales bacterium]|nr:glycine zipper 2TM domain-containing protein [Enterobacterales bacterium]
MNKRITIIVLLTIFTLSGCKSMGVTKEEFGQFIGAVGGAVLGSKIGKGNGKIIATVLGATLGSYIGGKIGASLDKKDQAALHKKSLAMLNSSKGQELSENWKSDHSQASASIHASAVSKKNANIGIVKLKQVQTVPFVKLIGKDYETLVSTNVRAGTSTQTAVVGGMAKGSSFKAVGITPNNWLLVSQNNITLGYVYAPLAIESQQRNTQTSPGLRQKAFDLDSMADVESSIEGIDLDGFDLDSMDLVDETIVAETECRDLEINIENKNKQKKENFSACKAADGSWELS